jgi:hypothetical protein
MKLFYLALISSFSICLFGTGFSQQIANLEGISYQAVALDTEGVETVGKDVINKPLYNREIGVRFTITGGENGVIYYQEVHSTTTNENGLFSLNIGQGTLTSSTDYMTLLDMPWINGDQWLTVEISLNNDEDFGLVSNEKLMAVPYTFYADDIADDAITTEKIKDFEILNQDFSTGSVDTRVILDSTILNEDFSTGSVDSRVIEDFSIEEQDLSTGSVDTRVILDSTILNEDFSTSSVDTRVIENFTILNEDMSTSSVDSRVIEDESIQNIDFADSEITLEQKFDQVLPVINGGAGSDVLLQQGLPIGNGVDPILVLPFPLDSGQVVTHINGVTEPYKMEAGPLLSIDYDNVNKIITFEAAEQTIGETGVGNVAGGNVSAGGQVRRIFPTGADMYNVGDVLLVGANIDLRGCTLTGYVSNTDEITFIFYNGSGVPVNLGPMAISVLNLGQ